LARQIHIEPLNLPVVYPAEFVVEATAQVYAEGIGIARDEPTQGVGEHDGARHHALVREEGIVS
jgi:hypothetical protein